MQYSSAIYLGQLDLVESTAGASAKLSIYSAAAPANCAAADTGTLLCTITLPADWMNAASGTSKTKLGTWTGTASAGAGATPTHFRLKDAAGTTCHMQGTAGVGTGECSLDGTITSGQTVTVNTFTINAANT